MRQTDGAMPRTSEGKVRREMCKERDWRWNTLAQITQISSFGFGKFADAPDDEVDCRVRSALRQIGRLIISRGVGDSDVRMADRQVFRKCSLDWLDRFIVELDRHDDVKSAYSGDALEMLATFVFVNCHEIVSGVADEFGLDPAVEARRADEMCAIARRDVFGAECVDGESGNGDAVVAAEGFRRRMIRELGFAFAVMLGRVALDCLEFGFEGFYFKVKRGDLAAAKEHAKALRKLSKALKDLEDCGDVGDKHDFIPKVAGVFCG